LRVQNIYIKTLLKPKNSQFKPGFDIANLGKNVKNLLNQKVAQNITISFGYFIFFKKSK
jgi:hypothetical protein